MIPNQVFDHRAFGAQPRQGIHLFEAGEDPWPDVAAVFRLDRQEAADAVRELGEGDEGKLEHVKIAYSLSVCLWRTLYPTGCTTV